MIKKFLLELSDFKKLIEGNYYYFDRTDFIDEIIKDGSEVKLFTLPRRFGKTLNISMLKYFFDIKEAEENRKLFKDLYIEKTVIVTNLINEVKNSSLLAKFLDG